LKKILTTSGIEIKEVYPEFVAHLEPPGQFPYTRGIQADMYRGKLWTMRQYAGFSTAQETNARYQYLLAQGTTGLSVAFDLPTQIGFDSDHPMAEGEVGKVGVAIDTLEDMEELFHGIPLETISTSMTINSTAAILLCMYIALARKQGVDLKALNGTIQNDILKEYAARGTFIYPPVSSMRLITDIFEYCSEHVPKWNTISISGYHIREAGSTAVQELAFTMANAKSYVLAALERGLDINIFSKRLSFFFNCHHNFFEEIAKFRAARKIWAELIQSLGATDPKAQQLRFHTQTAGSSLTAQQPLNNIVRTSLQAMAAVLGGTQSLHTNGYDEALSLPTEQAAQIALRTQQIIAFESGVADTVDPLAGSYFLESLTLEIEKKVKVYMDTIDSMGGAVKAIEEGYIQNEIAQASYHYQKEIEDKTRTWVGVNRFETQENPRIEPFHISDEIRQTQIQKLKRFKENRENSAVQTALQHLKLMALSNENLIPYILNCIESRATLGEISDVFREVFGEYKSSF
jgi:methylmalonyl-CoA mutase N-terminal domain/subunit